MMKNTANLYHWFLMKFPMKYTFNIHGRSTDFFFRYFALPKDTPICLFGNIYNDTRADESTTEFANGHRILTGDLIHLTPTQAETERSIYLLHSVHPCYAEWLKTQGYSEPNNTVIH